MSRELHYELLGTQLAAIEGSQIIRERKQKQTKLYNEFIGSSSDISAQELVNHVKGIDDTKSPIVNINYTLKLLLQQHRVAFIQKLNQVSNFLNTLIFDQKSADAFKSHFADDQISVVSNLLQGNQSFQATIPKQVDAAERTYLMHRSRITNKYNDLFTVDDSLSKALALLHDYVLAKSIADKPWCPNVFTKLIHPWRHHTVEVTAALNEFAFSGEQTPIKLVKLVLEKIADLPAKTGHLSPIEDLKASGFESSLYGRLALMLNGDPKAQFLDYYITQAIAGVPQPTVAIGKGNGK